MANSSPRNTSGSKIDYVNLVQTTREVLLENGEQPDHWVIAGSEIKGAARLFCCAPPFALSNGPRGTLLDLAHELGLGINLYLRQEGEEIESLIVVCRGFAGNLICEESFDEEDFPVGLARVSRTRSRVKLLPALQAALKEMVHLAYATSSYLSPLNFEKTGSKGPGELEIIVRPNGGIDLKKLETWTTLRELSERMGGSAARARLLRMRQGAQDCGGCGRCCSDADIPLTYFDVRNVAAHRFPALFQENPSEAFSRTREQLAVAGPGFTAKNLVAAPRLYFRKKDGTSRAGSPCVYLDGRGLCGVYQGRPLLCRLYHCAEPSPGLEHLYKSAFYSLEWLGRAVESGLVRVEQPFSLQELLEIPLARLASPYALLRCNFGYPISTE